jgi:hypothetical protein
MSSYRISPYSYNKAKKLGVEIKPSTNPKKKIDVYKGNKKIASIGAVGYPDFPTYLKEDTGLANKKREQYRKRHKNDLNSKPNGYYANKILW